MYDDPIDGLKAVKELQPDILFLDIEMPRLNGFELLELLGTEHDIKVIFVTAFNKYAVKAFEYYAVDYLLKPVARERLKVALDKLEHVHRKITKEEIKDLSNMVYNEVEISDKIVVPIQRGFQLIDIHDISWCKADNNYTKIHTQDGSSILVSKSLKHFEDLLPQTKFLRVHQSYLVNIKYVVQMVKSDGGHLLMKDNTQIPISRTNKSALVQMLKMNSV